MKKLSIIVAVIAFILLFSPCTHAADDIPSVYINGTIIDSNVNFVMQNSTMYLACDDTELAFGVESAVDAGGTVFTFSTPLRVITYDSVTGSVNITDKKSFLYEVYEKAYPSYTHDGRVYIPLRMFCTSLGMNVDYIQSDNTVKITSIRNFVGLFNSHGVAVAFRGGKYGLVNRNGDLVLRFSYDDISNFDNPVYYKLTDNHRCGLANSEGKLITEIAYNEIRYESPSIIYIRQGRKWGMCDISGEIIIPVKYDEVIYSSNLIGMVKSGAQWYQLDCRKGELSFQSYDAVYKLTAGIQTDNSMIEGYYVQKGDKWGYIDSFGTTVINLKYEALDKFDQYGRARMIYKGKFGIIDCGGQVIIPAAYDYIDSFGTIDVAVAQMGSKFGAVNDRFEVVIPFEYDYIYPFNNQHSSVAYKDGKFGVISSDGKHLSSFDYTHMEEFRGALALAYKNGYGYLDTNGNEVIPTVHSDVKQGTALSVFLKKDDKWALFSPSGRNLTGFRYTSAGAFSNGLSAVSVEIGGIQKYGYVNDSGDVIIPFEYSSAQNFKYGKAIVTKGGYSGIIDIENRVIIPFEYTGFNSSYDYNVIAAADQSGKWGLISFNNQKLCDFVYDYIFEYDNGYACTLKDHKYGVIDTFGNEVLPPIYKTQKAARAQLP